MLIYFCSIPWFLTFFFLKVFLFLAVSLVLYAYFFLKPCFAFFKFPTSGQRWEFITAKSKILKLFFLADYVVDGFVDGVFLTFIFLILKSIQSYFFFYHCFFRPALFVRLSICLSVRHYLSFYYIF